MWPFTTKPGTLRSARKNFKPGDRIMYVGSTGHDLFMRTPKIGTVTEVSGSMPQSGYVWVTFDASTLEYPPYTEAELRHWSPDAQRTEEEHFDRWEAFREEIKNRVR